MLYLLCYIYNASPPRGLGLVYVYYAILVCLQHEIVLLESSEQFVKERRCIARGRNPPQQLAQQRSACARLKAAKQA